MADGTWKELAENIDVTLPQQVKVDALLLVRDVFCNSDHVEKLKINCVEFQQPVDEIPLDELKSELSESDQLWTHIIEKMDATIDKQYHQKLFVSLVNILCHE